MEKLKPNQKFQVEIIRITGDGKGVAYTEDERLILISGISEDDRVVRIEIQNVFEETIFAKKVSKSKTDKKSSSNPKIIESPYEVDENDEDEYEDEEFY
jgi:predicted RNA-binding protein with TRAM domain